MTTIFTVLKRLILIANTVTTTLIMRTIMLWIEPQLWRWQLRKEDIWINFYFPSRKPVLQTSLFFATTFFVSFLILENYFFNCIQKIPSERQPNNYSFKCIITSFHVKTLCSINNNNDITTINEILKIVQSISTWEGSVSLTIFKAHLTH